MVIGHPDYTLSMLGPQTVPATHERRSVIFNDDAVVDRALYPILYTSAIYKGKFFTRGCRGMLESIQVYCDGDAADTLTLRYSPHPGIGPFGEVSIIPADGYAWQNFVIEQIWNYDSLFIWIHACTANITWGYDAALPYDGHESADTGATWSDMAIRPFIRAVLTGETPGDVPVSGVINTIEIPSVATNSGVKEVVAVATHTYADIVLIEGAGTLIEAYLDFNTSVAPTAGNLPAAVIYYLILHVDGVWAYQITNRQLTQSCVAPSGRCSAGEFYQCSVEEPAYDHTVMHLRIPIKFRRSLLLEAFQSSGAIVDILGTLCVNRLT